MRKQILLVESSAPIRSAVERLLRQEGYEVIAVDSAKRAVGVLTVAPVALALIGVGVSDSDGRPFYNAFTGGAVKSPFLALAPHDVTPMDLPDEVIVRCPFTAEELLSRVRVFAGASGPIQESPLADSPLVSTDEAQEQLLDAALGIDSIEVQSSETFGPEDTTRSRRAKRESMVGFDADVTSVGTAAGSAKLDDTGKLSDTAKIDLAFLRNKRADKPSAVGSGNQTTPQGKSAGGDHDYNWLVSEMQQEGKPQPTGASKPAPPAVSPLEAQQLAHKFSTPLAASSSVASSVKASPNPPPASDPSDAIFDWSDSPDHIERLRTVFTRQMVDAVAERVARLIADKLNDEKFQKLVETEIRRYLAGRHP